MKVHQIPPEIIAILGIRSNPIVMETVAEILTEYARLCRLNRYTIQTVEGDVVIVGYVESPQASGGLVVAQSLIGVKPPQ